MKRFFVGFTLFLVTAATASAQYTLYLRNYLGGDGDADGKDMLIFSRDENGDFKKAALTFSDRFQLDFTSSKLDSRLRFSAVNAGISSFNGSLSAPSMQFKAYVNHSPLPYLNFTGTNKYYTKYIAEGSYLKANDGTPLIGELPHENGLAVVFDGKSISKEKLDLKVALGTNGFKEPVLHGGFDYSILGKVKVGATFQNVMENAEYGTFVSMNAVKDLTCHIGYIWNNAAWTCSTDFASQQALLVSLAYNFKFADQSLSIAADAVTGLNGKYIAYNAEEKKQSTENYADENGSTVVPFMTALRVTYRPIKDLQIVSYTKYQHFLKDTVVKNKTSVFNYFVHKIPAGTVKAGFKLNFDNEGFSGFSFPFCWCYTFKYVQK